jgi:hypothetical protein
MEVVLSGDDYERARQCVNALAGVADPAAELATLRKEAEANQRFIADAQRNHESLLAEVAQLRRKVAAAEGLISAYQEPEASIESALATWQEVNR